jgi:hypothetical protein
MEKGSSHLVKRSPKRANSQFTLALHPELSPPLDEPRQELAVSIAACTFHPLTTEIAVVGQASSLSSRFQPKI